MISRAVPLRLADFTVMLTGWWLALTICCSLQATTCIAVFIYLGKYTASGIRRRHLREASHVAEKRWGSTVVPLAYSPINAAAKLDLTSPSVMPLAEGNPKLEIFTQVSASEINPFLSERIAITWYERCKLSITTVTLFPIRLLIFILAFVIAWTFARLIVSGADMQRPFSRYRRALQLPMRMCARAMAFALGYHWLTVVGRPAYDTAPVLVANHVSFVDPIVLCAVVECSFLAASEQLRIPLFGTIHRAFQTITVDRRSEESRGAVKQVIAQRAAENIERTRGRWPSTLVFPESTCTNGKALLQFKLGAFLAGVPVQPIALSYKQRHADPAWLHGIGMGHLFWRLMCQFHNSASLEFLPPHAPTVAENAHPPLFAENVRMEMANAMRVQATLHSYEDSLLQAYAIKLHAPILHVMNEFVPQMVAVKELLGISLADAKECVRLFLSISDRRSAQLSFAQFLQLMRSEAEHSAAMHRLFGLLDDDHSSTLSFREFLMLVALTSAEQKTCTWLHADQVRLLYHMYDESNAGLSLRSFELFLRRANLHLGASEARSLFEKADRDRNGAVCLPEFALFADENPELVAGAIATLRISSSDSGPLAA